MTTPLTMLFFVLSVSQARPTVTHLESGFLIQQVIIINFLSFCQMRSLCHSVSVVVTLVVLFLMQGCYAIAGFKDNTLLCQILSENLPWSLLSVLTFTSPHKHQEGLEASMWTKFTRYVCDIHRDLPMPGVSYSFLA